MLLNTSEIQRRKIEFIKPRKSSNSFGSQIQTSKISNSKLQTKNDGPKKLSKELFPSHLVLSNLNWKKITKVGPGLYNHGNTCFLNSVLQCLLYTPALVQIVQNFSTEAMKGLSLTSSKPGQQQPGKMTEFFFKLVKEVWSVSERSISPRLMVQNIRRVGRQFRPSRQEDAHEYLRQLLDCMHEEILKANGVKISDGLISETTFLSKIFGGYLCNELTCSVCKYTSTTLNHFQDLSLDVHGGINTIQEAIRVFLKPEVLGNGNEWLCGGCNKKVKATKQMSLHKLPFILVIHLKRFSYHSSMGKINKNIKFEEKIELLPKDSPKKVNYYLYALLIHHGSSVHSGHYVAYVKASNGQWYEMNDSTVSVSNIKNVLAQQAYILFYKQEIEIEETHNFIEPSNSLQSKDNQIYNDRNKAPKIDIPSTDKIVVEKKNTASENKLDCPEKSHDLSGSDDKQIIEEEDLKPIRLKTMLSWNLKPLKFLGYLKRFKSWKIAGKDKLSILRKSSVISPTKNLNTTHKNDITLSNTTVEDGIVNKLIQDANRSKVGGFEGVWDNVSDKTLGKIKKMTLSQRNNENASLSKRKISSWDAHLDSGRVKKIKNSKLNATLNSWDDENPFQNVLDQRRYMKS